MQCHESCKPKKLWMKECSQIKADAIERNNLMFPFSQNSYFNQLVECHNTTQELKCN